MKTNFKECKEMATKFMNGEISPVEFEQWSKEHCETCKLFIGKPGNKHCIFGKVNKNK